MSERDHDDVELDGREASLEGRVEAGEGIFELAAPGDRRELIGIERVETHVDALESGIAQLGGESREQRRVGSECEALDALDRAQFSDEVGHAPTDERLATGQPDLADALVHR